VEEITEPYSVAIAPAPAVESSTARAERTSRELWELCELFMFRSIGVQSLNHAGMRTFWRQRKEAQSR
jgi:hypothetical protein